MIPKPEELFAKYNPQDGTLPLWAKELMKEYARQVLDHAADKVCMKAKKEHGFINYSINRESILKIKDEL